jgi:hypothetical protein
MRNSKRNIKCQKFSCTITVPVTKSVPSESFVRACLSIPSWANVNGENIIGFSAIT